MYNKNNKSSRLINILVGVIAVLIIIFLIVFLVNKSNSNKTVENDQQFNENLNLLHQTAKEFFAGQLPDEVGGSLQTSLQELIEMGAIDDLEYGNEKCDTKESYISITKTGTDEYRVKSNLVCPGKSDSTVEKIKSSTTVEDENGNTIVDEDKDNVDLDVEKDKDNGNDSTVYCKDFKCTVEEIPTTCTVTYEYEYVKRSVSCPNGYNISGSVCTMETSDAKAPTPVYSNPTTTVENAKVNKGEPYKVYVDPIVDTTDGSYYCTEGTLQGDKCVVTANKITTYETTCPAGYNRVGDYCYIYASKSAGSTTSNCPAGYTDNGSNCYYRIPVTTSTVTGSCPAGYTDNGSNCYIREKLPTTTKTTCPDGYSQSGNYCYKYANKTSSTTTTCPAGTSPSGDKCVKKVSAVKSYTPWGNPVSTYSSPTQQSVYTHELEKKVFEGKKTIGVSTVYNYSIYRRSIRYTCSQGTLSGTTCLVYSNPITTSTTPKCPSGYTDNGSNCYIRTAVQTSTVKGSCPSGYTPNGDYCYKYVNKTTSTTTSCPSGYTQNGNYCYTYTNKVTTSTPGTCPAGFIDSGSTCYMKVAGTSVPVQNCPSGYSDNGYNCTKTVSAKYASGSTYTKCPTGYTQSGSGKNIECYKYETSEDKYYCENANAELKGTLCYVKEEAKFLENKCEYGYTLGADNMCHSSSVLTTNPTWTDVDYLFSSETYIPGYQRTGRGKFHQVCVRANGTVTENKHWK